MARKIGMLDAVTLAKTTTPGLYADGGGLYLQVTENGLKTWVYRFMLNGRRRDMGLVRAGSAGEVAGSCGTIPLPRKPRRHRTGCRLGRSGGCAAG